MRNSMEHYQHKRHEQHHLMGAFYAILAAMCVAGLGLAVKLIGDRASTNTVVFVRYLIPFFFILPWVLKDPKDTLIVRSPVQLFSRSIISLIATAAFFYALKFIPITNTLVLNNSSPLFVPLLLRVFRKKSTSPKIWWGLVIGFIGLILVLKPDPRDFNIHALAALVAGIAVAITTILVRELTKTTPIAQILFYNFLTAIVITGALLPFLAETENWVSLIPLFLLLGAFAIGYQYFSTLALAKAPAVVIAPIVFLSVVFGVPLDYFFWDNSPSLLTCTGMVTMIAGGLITLHFNHKYTKETNPPGQKL